MSRTGVAALAGAAVGFGAWFADLSLGTSLLGSMAAGIIAARVHDAWRG